MWTVGNVSGVDLSKFSLYRCFGAVKTTHITKRKGICIHPISKKINDWTYNSHASQGRIINVYNDINVEVKGERIACLRTVVFQ